MSAYEDPLLLQVLVVLWSAMSWVPQEWAWMELPWVRVKMEYQWLPLPMWS